MKGYLGLVRPPHLLWDADRVYVSNNGGVTALDHRTGKVLWHAKGPDDRLLLSGGLLFAADCSGDEEEVAARGRWLVARTVATGAEVFRAPLPVKHFDPLPIQEVVGLILVQAGEDTDGKGMAFLLDRQGAVRHRFDRQVVAAKPQGRDLVVLTSRDVVLVSPDGRTRWAIPFPKRQWIAGGGLLELPGGDVLVFLYGCISDSGVQLVRISPDTGEKVWQARCAPLGVMHSEYEHQATVSVNGDRVTVTSKGARGTFVELLDLSSGRQIMRRRP